MLIRPFNLPLCRVTRMVYTRGPWVTRRPSNQGSKKGHPPLVAPAEKFRSRIRFLQLSTGKVTPYGHVLYQFGETSYRFFDDFCCFYACGTNLGITSRLLTSVHPDPLNRSLVWDGGPGPMQATAYTAFLLTELPQFLSKGGFQLVWRGVHSGRNHRFGIKDPLFPIKVP